MQELCNFKTENNKSLYSFKYICNYTSPTWKILCGHFWYLTKNNVGNIEQKQPAKVYFYPFSLHSLYYVRRSQPFLHEIIIISGLILQYKEINTVTFHALFGTSIIRFTMPLGAIHESSWGMSIRNPFTR